MSSKSEEPPAIFLVGTAGSGKTTLASSLGDWLGRKGVQAEILNLDPGVEYLPYDPIVDVREYVDVRELMRTKGLGPNSALVLATDMLADYLGQMRDVFSGSSPDLFIADTPGQIELFAFRASGLLLCRELFAGSKAVAFLVDAPFSVDPMNYVSNMFLESAVYSRLLLPVLTTVTKVDLVPRTTAEQLTSWAKDPDSILLYARDNYPSERYLYVDSVLRSLPKLDFLSRPFMVSALDFTGFVEFNAAISRMFFGGEETLGGPPS